MLKLVNVVCFYVMFMPYGMIASVIMPSVVMPSVIMSSVITQSVHTDWPFTVCHNADLLKTVCHIFSVIMPSVLTLIFMIILSVIILRAPS